MPLVTLREPDKHEWDQANRGGLVPAVIRWKQSQGRPLSAAEQIFQWGFVTGYDEALALAWEDAEAKQHG